MSGDGGGNPLTDTVAAFGKTIDKTVTGYDAWKAENDLNTKADNEAKLAALKAASEDQNLDPLTRQEFRSAYESSNVNAFSSITAAAEGTGIYGIRRKNNELAKLLLEKPGSKQTILSVGGKTGGSVLGG